MKLLAENKFSFRFHSHNICSRSGVEEMAITAVKIIAAIFFS